jgi:hypothetical protein
VRKSIGYFEGTDAGLLTSLVCAGYDTLPVSNGYDSHGANVRLIDEQNRYDLLVGYLHKIIAPDVREASHLSYQDLFHLCRTYGIPLVLEVPSGLHAKAREMLGDPPEVVMFVDPKKVLDVCLGLLSKG